MNTKQKAEAWLAIVENFGRPTGEFQIITDLLKENRALLDALKTLADEEWRDDNDEILIDARTKARVAIAMCEENKDDN